MSVQCCVNKAESLNGLYLFFFFFFFTVACCTVLYENKFRQKHEVEIQFRFVFVCPYIMFTIASCRLDVTCRYRGRKKFNEVVGSCRISLNEGV